MHDRAHSCHGTGTPMKSGRAKLFVWAKTSPLREKVQPCKCFPYVTAMSTLIYNQKNSVIIKHAIILNMLSPYDSKSVSHWIMFDYLFHV